MGWLCRPALAPKHRQPIARPHCSLSMECDRLVMVNSVTSLMPHVAAMALALGEE